MISPESRTSDFESSIRKYLVDTLGTGENIQLFFDWIEDVPIDANGVKLSEWIIIHFNDYDFGYVSECLIDINLFTRNDFENDNLNSLTDKLQNYILDENATGGLKTIPYYNTSVLPWVKIGGIIPYVRNIFPIEYTKDSTKMRTVHIICKWGGK